MNELLNENLTLDYFEQKFSSDLLQMYNQPDGITQVTKDRIKTLTLSLTQEFKTNILDFYKINGRDNMTDDNSDSFLQNINNFQNTLLTTINPLRTERIAYSSVSLMWTGILTQLEKEAKNSDDMGLLMTVQNFLIEF